MVITPATIYVKAVIPAKAGIQNWTGCRIKSGMTFDMFNCQSNNSHPLYRLSYGGTYPNQRQLMQTARLSAGTPVLELM